MRSLGHSVLEASSLSTDAITLTEATSWNDIQQGDLVEGYAGDDSISTTSYYVTDKTEDAIALQDAQTSFNYVRDKTNVHIDGAR